MYMYVCVYIYIYIYRERERERDTLSHWPDESVQPDVLLCPGMRVDIQERWGEVVAGCTVACSSSVALFRPASYDQTLCTRGLGGDGLLLMLMPL